MTIVFRLLLGLLLAALPLLERQASAASTVNPTQPVQGTPYNAAPIRQNFQSAYNDITALQSLNAGPTAPAGPAPGELWLNTPQNQTLWTLEIWNSNQSQWLPIATLDSLNNLWITNVGGGLPIALLAQSTTDLGSAPQTVETITGPGPIFSFGTSAPAGIIKVLQFSGATTIKYNSTSLLLPGNADLVTSAGSVAIATALGAGNWQILFFQAAALTVAQGGTGQTALTAHAVLLGEGTSPVGFGVPGTAGYPLVSEGASSDPAFAQLNLAGAGVSGTLGVPNGGTGVATIPAHNLVVGADASAVVTLPPGTVNYPLVSRGGTVDPYYAILTPTGGGTGVGSLPPHGVVLGEAAAPVNSALPGNSGYPLISQGATADPVFGQIDLGSGAVIGNLPLSNLALIPSQTLLGNISGGNASPTTLNPTQVTANFCNTFTSALAGCAPASGGNSTWFLSAGGAFTTLPSFNAGASGIVPASGGGTANFLRADGAWAVPPTAATFQGEAFYNTPGTYTFVSPATTAMVRLWGGGGGAGGTNGTAVSSGGGAGGFCQSVVTGLTVGGSVTVVVGAGGAPGNTSPSAGGNGGPSSFGASLSASGGTGSAGANATISTAQGTGGTGAGCTVNLTGQAGGTPVTISAGTYLSGLGGASPFGGSTSQYANGGAAQAGLPGVMPGGGASGGVNGGQGGVGASGAVIIDW